MAINVVFFDIGDVLFSEDAPHSTVLHCIVQTMHRAGITVQWDDFLARFQRCVRQSPKTALKDAIATYVGTGERCRQLDDAADAWYEQIRAPRRYGMLQDGITEAVVAVRQRYRTGIIANQHPEIMDALTDYGITELMDLIVIDEIVGVSKPDPAIFTLALERAGCAPHEAIMVGDRPEVDIAPAKRLGMGTIRLRTGAWYVLCDPMNDDERADIEVRSPAHVPGAVDAVAAKMAGAAL